MDIVSGFCAINTSNLGWCGVIEGNRFCEQNRKTSPEALEDAEELYNKMVIK